MEVTDFKIPSRQLATFSQDSYHRALAFQPQAMKMLGFQSLRPGQDRAVVQLLMRYDTILVLPTSGGKSACYIIPTLCHKWRCLIFSPLVSLIQDQLNNLLKYNLSAAQISSGQTPEENRSALHMWAGGELQFLLVAPERQDSKEFMSVMQKVPPNLVCIDEAHCLSRWGKNFRPSYSRIGGFIQGLNPETVLCLTATATEEVEKDIRGMLGLEQARKVVYYPQRKNLILSSRDMINGEEDVFRCISDHPGPTIVYSTTIKNCEAMYGSMGHRIDGGALLYHGKMDADARTSNQEAFMKDDVRVMFATNAFGMGVNKPNIRNIIHRDTPDCVEALTQEIGRAGRDGLDSHCVLFFSDRSVSTIAWMQDQECPSQGDIERVFYYISRMQDDKHKVDLTIKQIAEHLKLYEQLVGSALRLMTVAKVLDRSDEEEKPAAAKVGSFSPESEFYPLITAMHRIGFPRARDGFLEFKLTDLCSHSGWNLTKIKSKLNFLAKQQLIAYEPPYRGATTKIIGDLKLMDFDDIRRQRDEKRRKLGEVKHYHTTPDPKKHDFLHDYFIPKTLRG